MSRLVPYRSKAPAAIQERIEQTQATTMYLVQTTGPTSYVIQEQGSEKKHKVLIGSLQTCSCGEADVCIHILFVMLKVLRVPAMTPIVWQKSLIDSEIENLLRGDYRARTRPAPTTVSAFLKKRQDSKHSSLSQTDAEEADAQRHDLVEGEVCAICQEDMVTDQPLTYCRKGCGNNFHIECMKVFGESRKQSKENIICPLCRHDWGDLALTSLKKEIEVANKAPNVHKGVGCRKCQTKPIRNERYRCVQCANTDLCDRCFKQNAHSNHSFVVKKLVADPWIPAFRPNQHRAAIDTDVVDELQNRELTTNDYDLLLQLDQREKYPIQEYLLSILGGQKISPENAKSFGDPGGICTLCRQSLRIPADVRSVLCGHAFHDSCLARAFLAQAYMCPHQSCGRILFPGLHNLLVKEKAKASGAKGYGEDKPTISGPTPQNLCSGLDASFRVMALQQSLEQAPSTTLTGLNNKKKTTRSPARKQPPLTTSSRPTGMESSDNSVLSIGSTALQTQVGLPPVGASTSGDGNIRVRVDNQSTDKDRNHPAITTDGAVRRKPLRPGKFQRPESREEPALLPPLQIGTATTNRMAHAEEFRAERLKVSKERMRKQREEKEDRIRHNQSNNASNHEVLNSLFPTIAGTQTVSMDEKLVRASELRATSQQRRRQESETKARRRKAYEDNQQILSRERSKAPVLDLSIGALKHG